MRRKLPSKAKLNALLRYEPLTGKLFVRATAKELAWKPTSKGYLRGRVMGALYMAHRIIWKMVRGTEPPEIDHRNGIKDDNRWKNLRAADRVINSRNMARPKSNTSGHIGVSRIRRRWRATIRNDGKQLHLGVFNSKRAAIRARKAAEVKFGYSATHGRAAQ